MNRILIIIALLSIGIFIAGLFSDLRFSDEVHHFLFSKDWYDLGYRPTYMQSVNNLEEVGFDYVRDYGEVPLWHFGLVSLWRLLGGVSENSAQFYQALFYFLLVLSSYLLAKELYGKDAAWYATIVVATIPLVTAFSVLLYQEVPVAAMTTFCLFLIVKRKIFWSAVVMGLAFLTKRNAFFLFPVFGLIILFMKNLSPKISIRTKKAFLFLIVAVIVTIPDFVIRYKSMGWLFFYGDQGKITNIAEITVLPVFSRLFSSSEEQQKPNEELYQQENKIVPYVPGSAYQVTNILKYLGAGLPLLLLMYLIHVRKYFFHKDLILISSVCIYTVIYFCLFREWAAVRLLSPIFPLLAVLASKTFIYLKSNKLKYLICVLCFLQFAGVLIYVCKDRKSTPDEIQAYDYLKKDVPVDSRVLAIEEIMLYYATNLRTVTGQAFAFVSNGDYDSFLWGEDTENKKAILDKYQIDYLFLQKTRIYDDSEIKHFGGWPKSFVDRLPSMTFMENVFENESVSIWKVQS
jgi:4-amino-4-deoxy-L-arabinose transferase-like glycosyltransferase